MYDYNLEDPNLDFETAGSQITRALKQAAALKNAEAPGIVRDGRGNIFFSNAANIGHIANRLAGEINYAKAEKRETALNAEEKRRYTDLAKQLVTPGTKKAKVFKQALEGPVDPRNPGELMTQVEQDVPLSPEEENQRQMGIGTQLLGLPSGKFLGQEAVRGGMMFPEKMAELRAKQEQQAALQAEKLAEQRARLEDQQQHQIFMKGLVQAARGGGRGGALPQAAGGGTDEQGNEIIPAVKVKPLQGQFDEMKRQIFVNGAGQFGVMGPGGQLIKLGTGGYRASEQDRKREADDETLLELARRANESAGKNPDAFGLKTYLPNVLLQRYPGQEGAKSESRRDVYRLSAEDAKRLYGANFSNTEQKRAEGFLPATGDTPAEIKTKTEGMLALVEESIARRKRERQVQTTGARPPGGSGTAPTQRVKIKDETEWKNLEKGTPYELPDGRRGVK